MWPRQHHRLLSIWVSVYDLGSAVGDRGGEGSEAAVAITFNVGWSCRTVIWITQNPNLYWFLCNYALSECVVFNNLSSILHVIACCHCLKNLNIFDGTQGLVSYVSLLTTLTIARSIVEAHWLEIGSFQVSVESSLSCQCSSGDHCYYISLSVFCTPHQQSGSLKPSI